MPKVTKGAKGAGSAKSAAIVLGSSDDASQSDLSDQLMSSPSCQLTENHSSQRNDPQGFYKAAYSQQDDNMDGNDVTMGRVRFADYASEESVDDELTTPQAATIQLDSGAGHKGGRARRDNGSASTKASAQKEKPAAANRGGRGRFAVRGKRNSPRGRIRNVGGQQDSRRGAPGPGNDYSGQPVSDEHFYGANDDLYEGSSQYDDGDTIHDQPPQPSPQPNDMTAGYRDEMGGFRGGMDMHSKSGYHNGYHSNQIGRQPQSNGFSVSGYGAGPAGLSGYAEDDMGAHGTEYNDYNGTQSVNTNNPYAVIPYLQEQYQHHPPSAHEPQRGYDQQPHVEDDFDAAAEEEDAESDDEMIEANILNKETVYVGQKTSKHNTGTFKDGHNETLFVPRASIKTSRYGGGVEQWGVAKMPVFSSSRHTSNAALKKRGLKRGKAEVLCKRGYGANDPENVKIVELYDNYPELDWNDIANILNDDRIIKGKKPTLSGNGCTNRYNRNAPIIYACEGRAFIPLSQRDRNFKRGPDVKSRFQWNDELDEVLVDICNEYDKAKWTTVARHFCERTGHGPINAQQAALRHANL